MKRYMIAVIVVVMSVLTGCATVDKGRFSVVDLDLRSPEQVLAQKDEKTIIYADSTTNKVAMTNAAEPRSFPFELLFKLLEVVKGRLMIFSLEWETK